MAKIPAELPSQIQDLRHRQALLCLRIERQCSCLPNGLYERKFVLAVSGGADSIALAIIFYLLAKRNKCALEMVCINHQLRPEALQEQNFVRELADRLSISFHAENMDTRKISGEYGIGLEEAGRLGRRKILKKICVQTNADCILTGHHSGDLAEDILMRLARGASWPGLGGMKMLNGHWFRPLLYTDPAQLRLFLQSINLPWHEDASNKSPDFTRNRFRNEILPLFLRENANFTQNIVELNSLARIDDEYWNEKTASLLSCNPWEERKNSVKAEILLPKRLLASLAAAERLRIYMRALLRLKKISGQPVHARARTLLEMENCVLKGPEKIFQFPGKLRGIVNRDGVRFTVPVLK